MLACRFDFVTRLSKLGYGTLGTIKQICYAARASKRPAPFAGFGSFLLDSGLRV